MRAVLHECVYIDLMLSVWKWNGKCACVLVRRKGKGGGKVGKREKGRGKQTRRHRVEEGEEKGNSGREGKEKEETNRRRRGESLERMQMSDKSTETDVTGARVRRGGLGAASFSRDVEAVSRGSHPEGVCGLALTHVYMKIERLPRALEAEGVLDRRSERPRPSDICRR